MLEMCMDETDVLAVVQLPTVDGLTRVCPRRFARLLGFVVAMILLRPTGD